jgi:galactonate dehydratase
MKFTRPFFGSPLDRRSFLTKAIGAAGVSAAGYLNLAAADAPPTRDPKGASFLKEVEENERIARSKDAKPMIGVGDKLKITKVETIFVKPRWLFLKIHTNAGITGLGEPIVEGRAKTVATAIEELTPYLMGKDPRPVAHHWQAMYRHAFYRGGPILTSAISGVDQALWDIKGKALGVPVYELLGGPTRARVRVYAHAGTVERMKQRKAEGFTAFKTGPFKERPARIVENKAFIDKAAQRFAELRAAVGDECDIGIDFHGAISQQTARLLIKAL